MARVKLVLWSLVAIATAGAVLSRAASAAPPEFGRCVKVAAGAGTFATANCTSEGGEKKFEWLPGPGPNPRFGLTSKPETPLFFEAVTSKVRLTCLGETGTGEVTGPTNVGNVSLTFTSCESGSLACNTAGAGKGEVLVTGATGTLGRIKAGETALTDKIGLDLTIETQAECGGGLVHLHIVGPAIATISPTHSMTTKRTWKFTEAKGFQKPTMFEGGVAETFEWTDNGSPEQVGLNLTDILLSEEKTEINTVF